MSHVNWYFTNQLVSFSNIYSAILKAGVSVNRMYEYEVYIKLLNIPDKDFELNVFQLYSYTN